MSFDNSMLAQLKNTLFLLQNFSDCGFIHREELIYNPKAFELF